MSDRETIVVRVTTTLFADGASHLQAALDEHWDQDLVERGVEPTGLVCEELRRDVERLLGFELGDDELRKLARAIDGIAGTDPSRQPGESNEQHNARFLFANAGLLFYGMALGARIERARAEEGE